MLVVLLDDVGIEQVASYGVSDAPPSLPSLDALARASVQFQVAWAQPSCSPTRASLLSGLHPFHTGVGRWIDGRATAFALPTDVALLPTWLRPLGYQTALAGKWHLTGLRTEDPATHPLRAGFDHHRGTIGNPREAITTRGDLGYFRWEQLEDGVPAIRTGYLTQQTTDDAIALAAELAEPWLLVTSYNGAHLPFHVPPSPLPGSEVSEDAPDVVLFGAMLRALDAELGRLLAAIDPAVLDRSWIVVLADNGSTPTSVDDPVLQARAKDTVFEGGIRVPFFVRPPGGTEARTCQRPVSVVDVVPTLLAAIDPEGAHGPFDGVSFLDALTDDDACAASTILFAETFFPNGAPPWRRHGWALRDADFKVVGKAAREVPDLYDLRGAPFLEPEAPLAPEDWDDAARAAYERLGTEARRLGEAALERWP